MANLKCVLITAANVHDGLGGVHLKGQRPVLPADIADIFIARGMAVLDETMTPEEALAQRQAADDARRQAEEKHRAEAAMRRHDQMPPAVRAAAHEDESAEAQYLRDAGVAPEDIPNPRRRRRQQKSFTDG